MIETKTLGQELSRQELRFLRNDLEGRLWINEELETGKEKEQIKQMCEQILAKLERMLDE